MQEKTTAELEQELQTTDSYTEFRSRNRGQFVQSSIAQALTELLETKGLKKHEVIAASGINEIYAYQIFLGKRRPSRDKLLALCLAMQLTPEEVQSLLKRCGVAPLYVKDQRDSAVYFALENGKSVVELNLMLYENGQKLL